MQSRFDPVAKRCPFLSRAPFDIQTNPKVVCTASGWADNLQAYSINIKDGDIIHF